MVPTLTFIAVFWVKGGQNDEKKDKRIVVLGEDEENMTGENDNNVVERGQQQSYRFLLHMARITPMLEGAVEAPIQFIFQVLFPFKKLYCYIFHCTLYNQT